MSESKRVVVVTGGLRGIGAAAVTRFQELGDAVAILDLDAEGMSLAEGSRYWSCDVTDSSRVDVVFAEVERDMGPIAVVVANAGIGGGAPVADLTDEQFRRVVDVNLFGVFTTARAAAKRMVPRRQGCIVTIGSVFGQNPPGGTAAYAASKAGVAAFTRSLALEMAPHGIRANCISPGHIATDLYTSALQRRAALRGLTFDEISREESAAVPLGRFGDPLEVADLIVFLASEGARYITGQRINVDGGLEPF
ncbi:MAG TPA: SDR family NAD(P)-dependent oxidoreductase [Thermomicrobiales bacterium]|nr:SDR family NAD(P)-dependent oxidoreductase [Thermomicrobiales bacterium]